MFFFSTESYQAEFTSCVTPPLPSQLETCFDVCFVWSECFVYDTKVRIVWLPTKLNIDSLKHGVDLKLLTWTQEIYLTGMQRSTFYIIKLKAVTQLYKIIRNVFFQNLIVCFFHIGFHAGA